MSFPEVYLVPGCLTDLLMLHKDEFAGYEQTGCMGSTTNFQTSCGDKYFLYSTYLDGPNLTGVVDWSGAGTAFSLLLIWYQDAIEMGVSQSHKIICACCF